MSNITPSSTALRITLPRVYAIVDAARLAPESLPEVTRGLLAAGIRLIQYRDKYGTPRQVYESSRLIAGLVQAAEGIFIVNDRADVAWAAGANGVHLGQDDLPASKVRRLLPAGKLIGLSTHSLAQVAEADRAPVDYVAFGPVFATRSKEKPDPVVGLSELRAAREITSKPLVAIGGINLENARGVIETGVDSIAVIDALLGAGDPSERARQLLEGLGER